MTYQDVITATQQLLDSAGISYTSVSSATDHELNVTIIAVETHEHGLFTYRNGELIKSVSHILRRILEHKSSLTSEAVPEYIFDVNGEQSRRLAAIKDRVRGAVERARQNEVTVELEPMTAYERLIVHSYAGQYDDITTISTGEGFERRVVISPARIK